MTQNNSRMQYNDGHSGELVTVPASDPKTALAFSKLAHQSGHKNITFQKFEDGEWTFDAVTTGKHREKVVGVDSPDHRANLALTNIAALATKLAKVTTKRSLNVQEKRELATAMVALTEVDTMTPPVAPLPTEKSAEAEKEKPAEIIPPVVANTPTPPAPPAPPAPTKEQSKGNLFAPRR